MDFIPLSYAFALASVIFAGLFSFLLKVGAERSHGSAALNTVISLVSLACSLIGMLFIHEPFGWALLALAFVNGFMYIFGSIARSEALSNIDATLFFPLYKVTGPILVLTLAVAFLGERLTTVQWLGFFLAVAVPVLLIDKLESSRQKNLGKGIRFLLLSTAMIGGGTILSKLAMDRGADVFTFAAVAYFITILGTGAMHVRGNGTGVPGSWRDVVFIGTLAGVFQFLGFIAILYAYQTGPMGIAYAINSTYILIPIVLSIWYYGEHWNVRKAAAIALSVLAVVLLK